ncbi:hypothetical protein D3C75_1065870 [compost metagenome]
MLRKNLLNGFFEHIQLLHRLPFRRGFGRYANRYLALLGIWSNGRITLIPDQINQLVLQERFSDAGELKHLGINRHFAG